MSRSIHTTRRQLAIAERTRYADREQRRKQIERLRESLDTKHAIKQQVWQERHQEQLLAGPTDVESIPIQVYNQSPFIHFPASAADLRAVMRLLPPGTLDGVSRIVLCLGTEEQIDEESSPLPGLQPDSFVGRFGIEMLPGVFVGYCLGMYFRDSATICIYAYVYDALALPDREVRELYLRLQMLSTLVHELAHHKGKLAQGARGRWAIRPGNASESYAQQYEDRWMQQIVVPYLEQAYPAAVQALAAWIKQYGGVSIPLSLLADGSKHLQFSAAAAFDSLVQAVDEQHPPREARFYFANDLYFAHYYPETLQCLAVILAEHPGDPKALALQARIARNEKRYDEAETLSKVALAGDASCEDAWDVLMDVYQAHGNWRGLEMASTNLIALSEQEHINFYARLDRTRARIELGDFPGAEADIAVIAQLNHKNIVNKLAVPRALLLLRLGRYEEALSAATVYLKQKRYFWRNEALAVRFEAARRLGRPREAGTLAAEAIAHLREQGYGGWMDHIIAEYGLGQSSKRKKRA